MKSKPYFFLIGSGLQGPGFRTALLGVLVAFSSMPPVARASDFEAIEAAASGGDAQAQFELGRAYFRGLGTDKDLKKSLEWLEKAAAQNHAEAAGSIGYFYTEGIAVEKDDGKAVEWFRKAAEAGSPKGQLNLGLMYRKGRGVEMSNTEGIKWIQKSVDSGLPDARYTLGELYFLGDDHQAVDREKAIPLLQPLADEGNPKAQNLIGIAYRDGLGGTTIDLKAAEEWFRRAGIQGEQKAQSNLGHLLVPEDPEAPRRLEALGWLMVSESQGELTAKKTLDQLRPAIDPTTIVKAMDEKNRIAKLIQNAKPPVAPTPAK